MNFSLYVNMSFFAQTVTIAQLIKCMHVHAVYCNNAAKLS